MLLALLVACGPTAIVLKDSGALGGSDGDPTDTDPTETDPTETDADTDPDTDTDTETDTDTDPTDPTLPDPNTVDDDGDGLSEAEGDCDDTRDNWREECPWVAVAAGGTVACGLRADGAMSCWGTDYEGVLTPPEGAYRALAVGWIHGCAITTEGALRCWGDDAYGQASPPEGSFVDVAATYYASCAVRDDGAVVCWGYGFDARDPTFGDARYTQVAMGGYSGLCAVNESGAIRCDGYLGSEEAGDMSGTDFVDVSVGAVALGLRSDGSVEVQGTDVNYHTEAMPEGTWSAVAAGTAAACGIEGGDPTCWGYDAYGQTRVPGGSWELTAVSVGGYAVCALTGDGNVLCWGYDYYGGTGP